MEPHEVLQLHLSCRKLPRMDVLSKSDPFVVVYQSQASGAHGSPEWVEIGRTEVIKDNNSPDFHTMINIKYFFEREQSLKFSIYDEDVKGGSLDQQDFIGDVFTTLAHVMGQRGRVEMPIVKKGKESSKSRLVINAEPIAQIRGKVVINAHAVKVDKKDLFGKSDPFFVVSREVSGHWQKVAQSEVVKKTLNPNWQPLTIDISHLCLGNTSLPLLFEVFDWDKNSSADFIGSFTASLDDIQITRDFKLINEKKKAKKKRYEDSGTFVFDSCDIRLRHSFAEYLRGGLDVGCVFGVDFTASNGDPRKPASLHYLQPDTFNSYATAIFNVGNIIQNYDSDQLFPAFGFGLKLPNGQVSFAYPLNEQFQSPHCAGIQGVLDAYYNVLPKVTLWGPTNFAPIINLAAQTAAISHEHFVGGSADTYHILCIITDGVISDMADTVDAIVAASSLPLSIVIIGVGQADFSAMEVLDSDDQLLKGKGGVAQRDIVQFVPYAKFHHDPALLAAEVLREIPDQVEDYFASTNIQPQHAPPAYTPSMVAEQQQELARHRGRNQSSASNV